MSKFSVRPYYTTNFFYSSSQPYEADEDRYLTEFSHTGQGPPPKSSGQSVRCTWRGIPDFDPRLRYTKGSCPSHLGYPHYNPLSNRLAGEVSILVCVLTLIIANPLRNVSMGQQYKDRPQDYYMTGPHTNTYIHDLVHRASLLPILFSLLQD